MDEGIGAQFELRKARRHCGRARRGIREHQLQLGTVMTIQENSGHIWPARSSGAVITAINKMTGK